MSSQSAFELPLRRAMAAWTTELPETAGDAQRLMLEGHTARAVSEKLP